MASTSNKIPVFKGDGDVNKFITKCELHSTLKGYEDEKVAVFIAEKLEDAAFDTYLAMATADKKDPAKVKAALVKAFDRPKRNREVAIDELAHRVRLPNEAAENFSYKISELVKYAYPNFNENTRMTLCKDYFVKGLEQDLQKELRKDRNFATMSLKDLAEATTYLEIAGANSKSIKSEVIGSVTQAPSTLESKIDNLITVLERNMGGSVTGEETVNYAGSRNSNARGYPPIRGKSRGTDRRQFLQNRRCRNCNSTEHLFRKCPERYCQACGNKGHDGWERSCPKYQ